MNPNGHHWIRDEKRRAIYARDDFRCAYCGKHVARKHRTLDHVIPREAGGSNADHNLVLACGWCNDRKGVLPILTFLSLWPLTDASSARPAAGSLEAGSCS